MAAYTGLFNKIKDKNFQLLDKLKLVRFAWCSDLVSIPNKHSVLIDVVAGLLVNRKKYQLSDDDVIHVWQCLYNILRTPLCSSESAETILVKPSLGQVIVETLQKCVHQPQNDKLLRSVIGCCHRVIQSSHLSYILTSKYDNLVSLLNSVSQLSLHSDGAVDSTLLYSILTCAISAYSTVQSAHHNQKQVLQSTVDKLVVPLSLFCHRQTDPGMTELQTNIMQSLLAALFNSTHREMYRRYLSTGKGGDKTGSEGCRPLENLFNTLKNLLNGKPPQAVVKISCNWPDVVWYFVPRFLSAFMKVHDKSLCQKMVQHLCSLIGLDVESAALCDHLQTSQAVRVVNSMLTEVHSADIYNVAKDNEAGGPQLKFYRRLAEIILAMPVSNEWYDVAITCLQMNHGILEPKINHLLTHGWLMLTEQTDTSRLGDFLSELFITYSKLRQMPKLFGFILAAIQGCEDTQGTLVCPRAFLDRLHDIIQALPQTTAVEIWTRLVEEVKVKYILRLSDNSADALLLSKLSCLLTLFRLYLSGIKMADYTITDMTSKKVHQLMSETETDILQPLYDLGKKQTDDILPSVLFLSYTWGELKLMLALYDKKYRAITQFDTATVSHPGDMGMVHPYLSSEKWNKVYKRAKKTENKGLQYLFDLLSIQKVKAILVFSTGQKHEVDTSVETVVNGLTYLPSDVTEEHCNASWDGQVTSISKDNCFVSRWQTVVTHLPILASSMSVEQFERIAQFVVDTFSPVGDKSSAFNLASLTTELLMAPVTMETRNLQSSILSSLWKHMTPGGLSGKSPKKKRKQLLKVAMVTEGVTLLSELDEKSLLISNSDYSVFMKGVTSLVSEVLSEETGDDKIDLTSQQFALLKMFEMLPLEFLSNYEKIRCFCGLCLLASVMSDNTSILHLLAVLLDGVGQMQVFQVVSPDVFLHWVTGLCGDGESEVDDNSSPLHVLLDKACQTIIRDFHVITQMNTFIDKLSEDLEVCCDQLHKKKIQRASQSERAKFTLAASILKHLTAQLQKQSLPQVIRESYRNHFHRLSSAIIKVIRTLRTVQSKKRVVSPSPHLIGCFSYVFHQSCVDLATDVKKKEKEKAGKRKEKKSDAMETDQEEKAIKTATLEPDILDSTDFVLRRIMENFEIENVKACGTSGLDFLQTACRHHQYLGTVFTSATIENLWRLLMAAVTRSHDQQKLMTSSKMADISDSDKISDPEAVLYENVKRIICLSSHGEKLNDLEDCKTEESILMTEKLSRQDNFMLSLHDTVAAVISSCDLDLFKTILENIVNSISPSMLQTQTNRMLAAMMVWDKLLAGHFSEKQNVELTVAAQHMLMNYQSCLEYLHCLSVDDIISHAVPILKSQGKMLNYGYKLIPRQTSVLCLHGCRIIPLEGSTYSSFIPACTAVQEVLVALITHHPNAVLSVIPSFVANIKHLLVSVIQHGCQDRLLAQSRYSEPMVQCANLVTRLLSLLEPHKVEFSKVAVYLLSDYAYKIQRVTLLPAVKRALLPGIYILLDIADRFQIAQLLMVLPHGTKEVFKLMYSDYTKYHKYSGKV